MTPKASKGTLETVNGPSWASSRPMCRASDLSGRLIRRKYVDGKEAKAQENKRSALVSTLSEPRFTHYQEENLS